MYSETVLTKTFFLHRGDDYTRLDCNEFTKLTMNSQTKVSRDNAPLQSLSTVLLALRIIFSLIDV